MFLASWSVSVFSVGLPACDQQQKQQSGENTHVTKFCCIPLCSFLPRQHPTHFHWDARVLGDNQADRCRPTASLRGVWWHQRGRSELKVEMGFPGPGMAGDTAVGWGGKHWLKQENSHYSSPVQGGHVPLGTDWLSSWSGSVSVINSTI